MILPSMAFYPFHKIWLSKLLPCEKKKKKSIHQGVNCATTNKKIKRGYSDFCFWLVCRNM